MAIGVSGSGGRRSGGAPPLADINVTPFVDVVLVLLIIFMITAHAMESGIDIDVPQTKTVATTTKELPVVNVTKAGEIFLGKDPINITLLVDEIHRRYPGQTAVYVRGDRQTSWDIGVQVMKVLGDAKFAISVVTQLEDRK